MEKKIKQKTNGFLIKRSISKQRIQYKERETTAAVIKYIFSHFLFLIHSHHMLYLYIWFNYYINKKYHKNNIR